MNKPRQKLESSRTSKITQKLVVFPEADVARTAADSTLPDEFHEDLGCMHTFEKDTTLRRVTAYLTAGSYRFRELQEFLGAPQKYNYSGVQRFDEVIYARYIKQPVDPEILQNFEIAVVSNVSVGEVFIFDYGAIVIWGLDEMEERAIIREFDAFELQKLQYDEIEIENFSFCHNTNKPPRLFNDIISLRSGHHMVKLTISHALAQSVKLAYFEELIESTIVRTKHIPHELSSSGSINMSRKEITTQIGELFVMRMNVNLISNVLDTPELFWSFPSLGPLYRAVRGYLEISQRVEVLNQRCLVLSDMLDMLRDHANIAHGETLEWIIILLIGLEIIIGLAKAFMDVYWFQRP